VSLARSPLKGSIRSFDRSADPCVDFYRFACGGWLDRNPSPDRPAWGRDSELAERNLDLLRAILEQVSASDGNRTPAEQKVGDYYASCVDERAIEDIGTVPLRKDLEAISGMASKKEIGAALARAHALGSDAFFSLTAAQDFKDATSVIAEIDQSGLGLPERDYYLSEDPRSEELRKAYASHIAAMLRLLGDDPESAQASAGRILAIETALARASLDVVERRDPAKLYHKIGLASVRAVSPTFDWNAYLKRSGASAVKEINVAVPAFLKGMEQILETEDLQV
jgi:endothelin-converting enzyme/putative endopeptidase